MTEQLTKFIPFTTDTIDFFVDTLYKDTKSKFPFYNIVQTDEDSYTVELSVAGYPKENITISVDEFPQGKLLTIEGKPTIFDASKGEFLHRGITSAAFKKQFKIAGYMDPKNARIVDGILYVDVSGSREPTNSVLTIS